MRPCSCAVRFRQDIDSPGTSLKEFMWNFFDIYIPIFFPRGFVLYGPVVLAWTPSMGSSLGVLGVGSGANRLVDDFNSFWGGGPPRGVPPRAGCVGWNPLSPGIS